MEQHQSGEPLVSSGISNFEERTRAILKIEDGCDRFCSYCIIPKARGRVRWKPIEDIKNEASFMEDLGADSLDLVELVMSFENDFDITIPDEDSNEITTVQSAIDYVSKKLG